jgi:5-methylcytosine-specific restriction endonuclease McrA
MGSCFRKPDVSKSPYVIISNKKKKKKKQAIPRSLKKMVWDKYIGENKGKAKCYCCKHQDIRQIDFEAGHVVAESMGGKTILSNLRPICHQCNISMGTLNMNVFIKKYNL